MTKELIGSSLAFRAVLREVSLVASVDCSVFLQGETGAGKEVIAQAIHDRSRRSAYPLITLNCAAIPGGLLESELFGHERGAFTGAVTRRVGRFQAADRGTLFLDEVGDLPLELQPKLLRVLQDQQIEPLGSRSSCKVNVRVIVATHQNLWKMVQEGRFRADLFYRLHVYPIRVPALRDRQEDIPLLAKYFADQFSERHAR
ncbi:MAG: sigma 54-interacting transcriptional regulator, partial [Bryobacteraceae bacterium]|nr:sigma 54-interacting transcriptional regulator [Bryobacteraceae bacterium]